MDGPPLSWQERQVLLRIEEGLRCDRRLERALSRMRPPPRPLALLAASGRRIPVSMIVLLAAFAMGLSTVVLQLRTPGVLALLGVAWGAALVLAGARFAAGRARSPAGPAGRRPPGR